MRQVFLLLLTGCWLNVFGQGDSIEVIRTPTLTAIGSPAGEKIKQTIGSEGGKIVSADRGMELIIPPGAVPDNKEFSIQPVTNTLLPGEPDAYELAPSGMNFSKPLQLIFHFSQDSTIGSFPLMKGIAWQDDKGQWHRLANSVVDSAAMTISGNITHFSRWVFFDSYTLTPSVAKVKVNRQLTLKLKYTGFEGIDGEPAPDLELPSKLVFTTFVNGSAGGNATVGTISAVSAGSTKFSAPATVPNQNPVDVSVETNAKFTLQTTSNPASKKTYSSLKLISHITIIDKRFELTVIGHNQQSVAGCTISGLDTSRCIVQLQGEKSKLTDIRNMNYKITITHCRCDVRELLPGMNKGPVNIVGASRIQILPPNPPKQAFPLIRIYFIPDMGVVSGMAVGPCSGNPPFSWPAIPFRALPMFMDFYDKDGEQTLDSGDEKNGYKVLVRSIDDDQ